MEPPELGGKVEVVEEEEDVVVTEMVEVRVVEEVILVW